MHTCSHRIDDRQYVWNVERLWEITKEIDPIPFPIEKLEHTFDWEIWGETPLTPKELLEHYTRTVESDLVYPIIVSLNGWGVVSHIYDGFHRLVKAKYKGYEKVMVVVVSEELLTTEGNYLSYTEIMCDCCGCNPCDCHGYSYN